jgi:8-oxo-dGTP pyrophosphatase MutT (NUDIX family)
MVWRHRFIIDRWVWELPGGYVDPAEDGLAAAIREVREETGWHPKTMRHVVTFQPIIGSGDCPQDVYVGYDATLAGVPDGNETEQARWVSLSDIPAMIADGHVVGAATIIGLQYALAPGSLPDQ